MHSGYLKLYSISCTWISFCLISSFPSPRLNCEENSRLWPKLTAEQVYKSLFSLNLCLAVLYFLSSEKKTISVRDWLNQIASLDGLPEFEFLSPHANKPLYFIPLYKEHVYQDTSMALMNHIHKSIPELITSRKKNKSL